MRWPLVVIAIFAVSITFSSLTLAIIFAYKLTDCMR